MRRREFIAGLGGAAAWPLVARAQQTERIRRIGVLLGSTANDPDARSRVRGFVQRLQELGWTEGPNVRFEYHWASSDLDRIRANAAIIVANSALVFGRAPAGNPYDSDCFRFDLRPGRQRLRRQFGASRR